MSAELVPLSLLLLHPLGWSEGAASASGCKSSFLLPINFASQLVGTVSRGAAPPLPSGVGTLLALLPNNDDKNPSLVGVGTLLALLPNNDDKYPPLVGGACTVKLRQ